jgi:hypothetical protein
MKAKTRYQSDSTPSLTSSNSNTLMMSPPSPTLQASSSLKTSKMMIKKKLFTSVMIKETVFTILNCSKRTSPNSNPPTTSRLSSRIYSNLPQRAVSRLA